MQAGLITEASESRSSPSIMYLEFVSLDTGHSISLWVEKTPASVQASFGDWLELRRGTALLTPWEVFEKVGAVPGVEFDIPLRRVGMTTGAQHPDRQLA